MEGTNPFNVVDRQRTEYGEKNTAYFKKLLTEILLHVQENDPYLYKFICFIYNAMMRPSEIKRLKVKDIDLEKRLIRIEAAQSKVKCFDILPIADELFEVIKSMNLETFPQDYYLFTTLEYPSTKQMSHFWTTEHYKKIKNHFGLNENYSI